jgi:signal transduction histidine kinase
MQDQQQPFAVFVLEALVHRSTEVCREWAEHADLASIYAGEPGHNETNQTSDCSSLGSAERLVQAVVAADGNVRHRRVLTHLGTVIGTEAHRRHASLHRMLEELDLLSSLLLRSAADLAGHESAGSGREGLIVARRITDAMSQLRLAAVQGYAQAMSDELRERYRAIRHDLRNPLGTIKSAIALLTDESVPIEMRESRHVRAMVVRNTSSLDQLIGEILGDTAARLRAFETPGDAMPEASSSTGEQRDDVTRTRKRPDFEAGAL